MTGAVPRLRITLQGVVQGVGLRPAIWRMARADALGGFVTNTAAGVVIEVEGAGAKAFAARLRADLPGRVEACLVEEIPPTGIRGFEVRQDSGPAGGAPVLVTDRAPCGDCLRELLDPADRRHGYPFISCAACGPRFTVSLRPPWERGNTTMGGWPPCEACQRELQDPQNRRFHAVLTSCAGCGPTLTAVDARGNLLCTGSAALTRAAEALQRGEIVACLGAGGFHLLTDATSPRAVATLRERKRRPHKPLAVLVRDREAALALADASEAELAVLTSAAAPVVILAAHHPTPLAAEVAPGLPWVGLLLPSTPLLHLLVRRVSTPLVATSGNRSGEPICADPDLAVETLGSIADLILLHDLPIAVPMDDAVVRVMAGHPRVLRLGRGFAPVVLPLPASGGPAALGCGGHLKATAALASTGRLVVSHEVGRLDTELAVRRHRAAADALLGEQPAAQGRVVTDLHPGYGSRYLGEEMERMGWAPRRLQHHHAHARAAMAEGGLDGRCLAVVWDGAGLGTDGDLWGGELLEVDGAEARVLAHLRPFGLPGGEAAVRDPRRTALSLLAEIGACDLPVWAGRLGFPALEAALLTRLLRTGDLPRARGLGRLLDGCAALGSVVGPVSWEGQAGALLEGMAEAASADDGLPPLVLRAEGGGDGPWTLDWEPLVRALAGRCATAPMSPGLALALHRSVVEGFLTALARCEPGPVVLAGGCFQNRRLLETMTHGVQEMGRRVFSGVRLPVHDGALAAGQAAWGSRRSLCGEERQDVPRDPWPGRIPGTAG